MSLKWDSWPVASVDYDLYLYRSSDLRLPAPVPLRTSETRQSGFAPPRERFCYTNTGATDLFAITIFKAAGTGSPRIDLFVSEVELSSAVAAGSVVEPATSNAAFAVGALCWSATTIASYSSQGPTIDGRVKPDIVAPTSVSTATYGAAIGCFGGFAGTSASAPHVAAAAALVRQANPTYTAAQVRSFLEGRAQDLGVPGKDVIYGAGKLWLGSAASSTPTPSPTATPVVVPGTARSLLPAATQVGAGFSVTGDIDRTFDERAAAITPQPPYRTGAETLRGWGWQSSSQRQFYKSTTSGVYEVDTVATVYASSAGAASAYAYNLTNIATVSQQYTTSPLGAGIGEQSAAYTRDLSATGTLGGQVPVTELLIVFRAGRVSNAIYVYSYRFQMDNALAVRLAQLQASRSIALGTTAPGASPTPAPAVPSTLAVRAASSTVSAGTAAQVSAVVSGSTSSAGLSITFVIDAAPSDSNPDLTLTASTDASGTAVVTYSRAGAGTDTITAYLTSSPGIRGTTVITWTGAAPSPSPSPTPVALPSGCTPAQSGTPTSWVYLPYVAKEFPAVPGWTSPFIVQNTGSANANVEISLYSLSSQALATCKRVDALKPGTSFAFVPSSYSELPNESQYSVVIRSFGAAVVSVVNMHRGSGERAEATSYVGMSLGDRVIYLPNVVRRFFGFRTPFYVQNIGVTDAAVRVRYVSFDGSAPAVETTRSIQPGRSSGFDPDLQPGLVDGKQYAVTVSADGRLAVVVNTFNDEPGVAHPIAYTTSGLGLGATEVYGPYALRDVGGRVSTIVVQNMEPSIAVRPTIRFVPLGDSAGSAVTFTAPAPLAPGASWAFDPRFALGTTTPCSGPTASCLGAGEYTFVVRSDGGKLAAAVNVIGTTQAMGYRALPVASTRYYLPNLTRRLGGADGWTTPVFLQSIGAVGATLRWYRLSDGVLVHSHTVGLTPGRGIRIDPTAVTGLTDDTQYGLAIEATGGAVSAIVMQLAAGGDNAMIYEGIPR